MKNWLLLHYTLPANPFNPPISPPRQGVIPTSTLEGILTGIEAASFGGMKTMNREDKPLQAQVLEKRKKSWEQLIALVERNLDFGLWGFRKSYTDFTMDGTPVIYDSEWCRIRIKFKEWESPHQSMEYIVRVHYGRLHAPNDKGSMIWNAEECYCWHGLWGEGGILNFLDGLTPQEVAAQKGRPRIVEQLSRSELGKSLEKKRRNQPEQMIQTHVAIWEHYGQVLFELFDLRRPDLWEQYRKFLKGYYDIKGRNPHIKPSPDQVC